MRSRRALRLALLSVALATAGCTTLRELPREQFGMRPERKGLRVETRSQLVYEFDYAAIEADTVVGYRNRPDVEGPLESVVTVRVPFDDVERLYTRQVDWRRTGAIAGGVLGSALWVGLGKSHPNSNDGNTSGGGKPVNP